MAAEVSVAKRLTYKQSMSRKASSVGSVMQSSIALGGVFFGINKWRDVMQSNAEVSGAADKKR